MALDAALSSEGRRRVFLGIGRCPWLCERRRRVSAGRESFGISFHSVPPQPCQVARQKQLVSTSLVPDE